MSRQSFNSIHELERMQYHIFSADEHSQNQRLTPLPYSLLSWVPLAASLTEPTVLLLRDPELSQLEPNISELMRSPFPLLIWIDTAEPTLWPEHCLANYLDVFIGRVVTNNRHQFQAVMKQLRPKEGQLGPALVESVERPLPSTPLGRLHIEHTFEAKKG